MSDGYSAAEVDYGDVNLESILQGNFSSKRKQCETESRRILGDRNFASHDLPAPTYVKDGTNNSHIHLQFENLPRDKEIMQIMNEFNSLMKEIGEDQGEDNSNKEISQSSRNNIFYFPDALNTYIEPNLLPNVPNQTKNLMSGNFASGHANWESRSEPEPRSYEVTDDINHSENSAYRVNEKDYLRVEKKIIDFVLREDNGDVETNPNFLLLASQSRKSDTMSRKTDSELLKADFLNQDLGNVRREFPWSNNPPHQGEFDSLQQTHEVGNEYRRDRMDSSMRSSVDSVDSEDSLVTPSPARFDAEDRDAVLLRSSHNSAVEWSSSNITTSTQPYNVLLSVKDALNSNTQSYWANRDFSIGNDHPPLSSITSIEDMRKKTPQQHDTMRLNQPENVKIPSMNREVTLDRHTTASSKEEAVRSTKSSSRSASSLLELYRDGGERPTSQPPSPSVDSKRVSFQRQAHHQPQSGSAQPQVRLSSSYSDSSFLLPGPKQAVNFDETKFQADANHLHDEAIRSASRENMTEIEKMARMNRTLIDALSEEKAVRQRLEEKLASHADELAMLKTQCDVDLDSYRLEVIRLKSQLRAVCEEKSLADIYGAFEGEITRLLKEIGSLRRVNLELETKELDKAMLGEKQNAPVHSPTPSTASYLLEVANKENNRLLLKLKKSGQEREALREQYETLKMRERQFLMSSKLAQDASRRLRSSHQDLQRARKALEVEQSKATSRERDLQLLKSDCEQTRQAEQSLRSERARVLAELSLLRDRVRQMEDEKRRSINIEKFIGKHANADARSFGEPPVLPGSHPRKVTPPRSVWKGLPLQSAAGLGFNYSKGMYLRAEEQMPSDSLALEEAMGVLHEGLIAQCPALLPAFRRLGEQIHHERAKALERTSSLLAQIGHNGTDSSTYAVGIDSLKKSAGSVLKNSGGRLDDSNTRGRSQSPVPASASSTSRSGRKFRTLTPFITSSTTTTSSKAIRSPLQREQDSSSLSGIGPPTNNSVDKDGAYIRLLRSLDPGRLPDGPTSRTSKIVSFEL